MTKPFIIILWNTDFFKIIWSWIHKFEWEKNYYSTSSIKWVKILEAEKVITLENKPSRANMQPVEWQVIFAKMAKTLKVMKIDEDFAKSSILSTWFLLVEWNKKLIDQNYLYYYLISTNFNSQKDKLSTWSTQVAINNTNAKKIEVPIFPLLTQKRIVQEIEKQFSKLDSWLNSLLKTKENLKQYKASVLKSAVEWKLTKEWRESQTEIESASVLLEKILKEKKEKFLKDFPKKKYKEPEKIKKEDIHDIELPENWCFSRLSDIFDVWTWSTPNKWNKDYWNNWSIPWLTSSCVNFNYIYESELFTTEKALKETNIKIFSKWTILIAMYWEWKTRWNIVELWFSSTTNQALAWIIFNKINNFIKDYLKIFFFFNYNNIRKVSAWWVQPNLNVWKIKNIVFPLPPLKEQNEIVKIVEEKLSVVEKLEKIVDENIKKSENLKQSILKKAFEWRLVEQKEEDWNVEELLKEIKLEKAKIEKEEKEKKKSNKKKK